MKDSLWKRSYSREYNTENIKFFAPHPTSSVQFSWEIVEKIGQMKMLNAEFSAVTIEQLKSPTPNSLQVVLIGKCDSKYTLQVNTLSQWSSSDSRHVAYLSQVWCQICVNA